MGDFPGTQGGGPPYDANLHALADEAAHAQGGRHQPPGSAFAHVVQPGHAQSPGIIMHPHELLAACMQVPPQVPGTPRLAFPAHFATQGLAAPPAQVLAAGGMNQGMNGAFHPLPAGGFVPPLVGGGLAPAAAAGGGEAGLRATPEGDAEQAG